MRYSRWWLQLTAAALAVALIASALAQTMVKVPPATDRFQRTWARTDKPVADGAVSRTWMWGPEANTGAIPEPYAEAPGSSRTVQYFDKSRMEDNSYRATEAPWDVTNGLLVVEMVEGHYQIGDAQFDELPAPADINIAGDPGERPTYADINRLALRTLPATPVGTFITATYRDDNTIGDDPTYISADVTAAQFVPETSHTVASPFWTFMTSSGTVWESDAYVVGPLFLNPFYATGFPITEAYWSSIAVGGTARDVLWQCFERRCLTYTPTNEPAWQVEAGNVGQHYYRWRYELPQATPTATATAPSGTETPETMTPTATASSSATETTTSTATRTPTATATATWTATPTATATQAATATPTPTATRTPTQILTPILTQTCHPSYPDFCIPPPPDRN